MLVQGESWWIPFLVNVVSGMLAGGITNTIAVWILFNPKQKRFGIQGAIPKNQARLARSLGKTVGERLVTPGDLQEELGRPELRGAFEHRLVEVVEPHVASQLGHGRMSPLGRRGEPVQAATHVRVRQGRQDGVGCQPPLQHL